MKKSSQDSHFEVWSHDYINKPSNREKQDREAVILQIEHGNGNNYMVEIFDGKKE